MTGTELRDGAKRFLNLTTDTEEFNNHIMELVTQVWNMLNNRDLFHHEYKTKTLSFAANDYTSLLPEDFDHMDWVVLNGTGELEFIDEQKWGEDYVGTSAETTTGTPANYRLPQLSAGDNRQPLSLYPRNTAAATIYIGYHCYVELLLPSVSITVPDNWAYLIYYGVGGLYWSAEPLRASYYMRFFNLEAQKFKEGDKRTEAQQFSMVPDLSGYWKS